MTHNLLQPECASLFCPCCCRQYLHDARALTRACTPVPILAGSSTTHCTCLHTHVPPRTRMHRSLPLVPPFSSCSAAGCWWSGRTSTWWSWPQRGPARPWRCAGGRDGAEEEHGHCLCIRVVCVPNKCKTQAWWGQRAPARQWRWGGGGGGSCWMWLNPVQATQTRLQDRVHTASGVSFILFEPVSRGLPFLSTPPPPQASAVVCLLDLQRGTNRAAQVRACCLSPKAQGVRMPWRRGCIAGSRELRVRMRPSLIARQCVTHSYASHTHFKGHFGAGPCTCRAASSFWSCWYWCCRWVAGAAYVGAKTQCGLVVKTHALR